MTTTNNDVVNKTIYSPSPTIFKEPRTAAFTGFITTTGRYSITYSDFNVSGSFNKGWNFYSRPNFVGEIVFFSALGIRDASTGGSIIGVGFDGRYWSSGLFENVGGGLALYSNYIYTQNKDSFSQGLSSRPVLE